jgi:hypothetical protein
MGKLLEAEEPRLSLAIMTNVAIFRKYPILFLVSTFPPAS